MTSGTIRALSLALLAGAAATVMSAGVISPCPTASVAVYQTLTAPCQVGSLEFSGFAYTNVYFPTMPGPVAGAVMVTPSTNPADPGLNLSAAWNVSGDVGMDSALTYLVQTISGLPTIGEADFGMTEVTTTPPVSVLVSETLCVGVAKGPGVCPPGDLISLDIPNTGSQWASATFGPVSELTISDDIYIKANGGTGSISNVSNNVPGTVPEPGTPLLGLSGLLMLGLLGKFARQ